MRVGERSPAGELADRGARLFDYLAFAQRVGMKRISNLSAYARDGAVVWLADVPAHERATYDPDAQDGCFLTLGKVKIAAPPEPDLEMRSWLVSQVIDKPGIEPELLRRREISHESGESETVLLTDHPGVVELFDHWQVRWRSWAERTRRDMEVLGLYRTVYDMYTQSSAVAETLEVVLGVGCLEWRAPRSETVKRHILTVPVLIEFDSDSGKLTVSHDRGATEPNIELLDILEHSQLSAPGDLHRAEEFARDGGISLFDRSAAAGLVRMLINCVDPEAGYLDEMRPTGATGSPTAAYAPALIMRRRGRGGLVRVLRTIADTIRSTGTVPTGLRPLVDPEYRPHTEATVNDGAIVRDGADSFLPLPLNEVQLRILDHVDSHAHTIVQGPPGTGKTHTAAALITHLLAQGKRVLVTAQTDRALKEVRRKLPEPIRPLCVAVVGSSRDDFADLKVAVDRISQMAADHEAGAAQLRVSKAEQRVVGLRQQRAGIHDALLNLREREVAIHEIAGYRGTLSELVVRHRTEAADFGWAESLLPADRLASSGTEIAEWRRLQLDPALADSELSIPLPMRTDELAEPAEFARLCRAESEADSQRRQYESLENHPWRVHLAALPPADRSEVQARLTGLQQLAAELTNRPERWIIKAVSEIQLGRLHEWQSRCSRIGDLLQHTGQVVDALGFTQVTVAQADTGPLEALAESLRRHIEQNGPIKVRPDGLPKIGIRTPRIVKDAAQLFAQVRVDGQPPTTPEQLNHFLRSEQGRRLLFELDRSWPVDVEIPPEDTLQERVAWHRFAHMYVVRLVEFGEKLAQTANRLTELELSQPNWAESEQIRAAVDVVSAVAAHDNWVTARVPLDRLETRLGDAVAAVNSPCLRGLSDAVSQRDVSAYRRGCERFAELQSLREKLSRRAGLDTQLSEMPALREAITASLDDAVWDGRLADLTAAQRWVALGRWLSKQPDEEANALCRSLDAVEAEMRNCATELAVTRAWELAIAPDRLTETSKQDLRQYAQLVRRLGKGSGKYADQRQASIRDALGRCRTAVPVWIMPLYRVVEQLDIAQNMFDVIIVDEASQAGLEAVFLQYLAPRIVVIGDDKQVSPAAVGIDQSQLNSLAVQYLYDHRFRDTLVDPKRSLFDEAAKSFESRLTLVEHRRCVPEIIEFSNRIAYEPENIRLVPVRLFGSDRLPPIRTVHVADGINGPNNTNPVEAEHIVAQIEKCLADPRYDGKTFGVISLLGARQAKLIWNMLVTRIQPEEITRRDLRCGDAADFQGAERDVIFLSMVKAAADDERLTAQTMEAAVQRYNVAVSRARDQLWLYHSVTADQLRNPEDLRFRLIDYCHEVQLRVAHDVAERQQEVPDDQLVAPFESLFEQQVFNHIVRRGYRVLAHDSDVGHDIDLVIVGGSGRVAVQCDGDRWDGPEQYRRELSRQRDLERCDWPVHRIRQSDFVSDAEQCLQSLWDLLDERGLYPIGRTPTFFAAEAPSATPADVTASGLSPAALGGDVASATAAVGHVPVAQSIVDLDADHAVPDAAPGELTQPEYGETELPRAPMSVIHTATASGITPTSGAELDSRPPVWQMEPYEPFTAQLQSPTSASHRTIINDFVRVVEVEGPVSGARLRAAYVSAARTRGTEQVTRKLDAALRDVVAEGKLLVDDPLGIGYPELCTYRVPGQPESRCRQLGPRSLDEVPARELADVVAHCAIEHGWQDRKALMRGVLDEFRLIRLTDHAIAAIAMVLPLAQRTAGAET